MAYYEAIIGTAYREQEQIPLAVAEAMFHLSPVNMVDAPIDVNIYGGDGEQMIGVGVVFETDDSPELIEDCGAETVTGVSIR